MENENNFLKKNWLTLLLVALLGGVCFMWMKDREDAKAKSETSTEKVDSAVSAKESVDSLAGTSAKVDSIPKEEVDSLKDAPIVKLRPSLIKGPACMVANTFESYYPRNVIDGNRSTGDLSLTRAVAVRSRSGCLVGDSTILSYGTATGARWVHGKIMQE